MAEPIKSAKKLATVIDIENDKIELKSVKQLNELPNSPAETAISIDTTDQGCSNCGPPNPAVSNKENVSLSLSTSSDDETVQAISLSINKKSNDIAYKGMMDIALLTANANQLRFLITYNSEEKTFYISAGLIVLSLIIQVAVGIGLIFKRQMRRKGNRAKADKAGSFIISGIFCLAVINVLVVSFTTTSTGANRS